MVSLGPSHQTWGSIPKLMAESTSPSNTALSSHRDFRISTSEVIWPMGPLHPPEEDEIINLTKTPGLPLQGK